MRRSLVRLVMIGGVLAATVGSAAAQAAPGATLYDVTETMRVVGRRVQQRLAKGALAGVAQLGTPFCPETLAPQLPAGATQCWVVALGGDDINLTNGQGTLTATVVPVTTGDNPFAAPELVLGKSRVVGTIDFSPALGGLPFGTVKGRVNGRSRFTGVFLQPFLGSVVVDGRTLRQQLCPLAPDPNPNLGGVDYAWVEVADGQLTGNCIDIQADQMSLGYPPLRFDLFFE